MDKDLVVKLLTGVFAKTLRYALTAVGGTTAYISSNGEAVNYEQVAAGAAAIVVALGWSLWEDYTKKKSAAAAPKV